ncbi:hypothetical protein [Helicobacter brantae]|nr:hypothetical protein [Helicobacter brantae]
MIAMNQNFLYFFLKTDIYKHKQQAQMFIKSYTSKLNKSFIGDQEYFNTNLYTNLFSNEDDFFQTEIDDLTQLECQCNNWHIEDSIKNLSVKNIMGITYWSVLILGKYLAKKFSHESFFIFGDIQCHITKRNKRLLPISTIGFHKLRDDEEPWLEENLDLYNNAILTYTLR